MANPQTENGFLRIANEIWDEVIRRDFSKRQKDIILFIWRLSYGCRKNSAHIPMLKDFELCGVGQSNVTKELNYLLDSRVISWNKVDCIFTVNKDYERWQVSPVKGWSKEKFKKLINQNITKEAYQNDKSSLEKSKTKVIITYQNNKSSLIKMISPHLLKREVQSGFISCRKRARGVSKDIIKDSIKNSSSSIDLLAERQSANIPAATVTDFSYPRIYKIYENDFAVDHKITSFEVEDLGDLFDTYGGEWLMAAMREAVLHKKRTLKYINGILKGFKERGGPEKERAQPTINNPPLYQVENEDPITQMLRKESERQLVENKHAERF